MAFLILNENFFYILGGNLSGEQTFFLNLILLLLYVYYINIRINFYNILKVQKKMF